MPDVDDAIAEVEEKVAANKAKKQTRSAELRDQYRNALLDEMTAKLARPSKNRYVPGDMVAPIVEFLEVMQETDGSVQERAFDLKRKIAAATDETKKMRYQKRLDNLKRRRETEIGTLEKIRTVYGKYEAKQNDGEYKEFTTIKAAKAKLSQKKCLPKSLKSGRIAVGQNPQRCGWARLFVK